MGGEVTAVLRAFEQDPKMYLYFYGEPKKGDETEGRTVPVVKIGSEWKVIYNLTAQEWQTLPRDVELRVDVLFYYNPETGLDKDRSKHFYTMLHEFAVHVQPLFNMFMEIRKGTGPRNAQAVMNLNNPDVHHDAVALGKNRFYDEMYKKTLEQIRHMELAKRDTLGVFTEGLVEQRDIDEFTQKCNLADRLNKMANEEITVAANALQRQATRESYVNFHHTLEKHVQAIKPVKEDLEIFLMMRENWPELVRVFPPGGAVPKQSSGAR